jgi:hypothetical protein
MQRAAWNVQRATYNVPLQVRAVPSHSSAHAAIAIAKECVQMCAADARCHSAASLRLWCVRFGAHAFAH